MKKTIIILSVITFILMCILPAPEKVKKPDTAGLEWIDQIEYRCRVDFGGCGESYICCMRNPDCNFQFYCPQCGAPMPIWHATAFRVMGFPNEECDLWSVAKNDTKSDKCEDE